MDLKSSHILSLLLFWRKRSLNDHCNILHNHMRRVNRYRAHRRRMIIMFMNELIQYSNPHAVITQSELGNFWEIQVPLFTENDWIKHFKMTRSSFDELRNLLNKQNLETEIGMDKELAVFLWRMQNKDSPAQIEKKFGIGESKIGEITEKYVEAIFLHFPSMLIKFPRGDNLKETMKAFHADTELPCVVGCIAKTHFYVHAPNQDAEQYVNIQNTHSIILQIRNEPFLEEWLLGEEVEDIDTGDSSNQRAVKIRSLVCDWISDK